jgi:hypothetical protein
MEHDNIKIEFYQNLLKNVNASQMLFFGMTLKNSVPQRFNRLDYCLPKFNLRNVQYMAGHRYVSSTGQYKETIWKILKVK